MGKIFSLDAETKRVIQDALDDLLADVSVGGLGKTCLLVYPPRWEACANCVLDPLRGKSSNRWRSGGPLPFSAGQPCPLCDGQGRRATEVSTRLTLKCNWEPRKFTLPVPGVDLRVPGGLLETKGYLSDLPKILKADHLVVNLPVAPYLRQKFKLAGEPGDPSNIIQARYFFAQWTRLNA